MDLVKPLEKIVPNVVKEMVLVTNKLNLRVDGRTKTDLRHLKMEFLDGYGDVLVSLGETKAIGRTTGTIIRPRLNRLSEGMIFFRVNLKDIATPAFREYRKKEEWNVEIEKIVDESIRGSKCVDLEALCILSGEYVWKINTEVDIIDYNGNIIDVAQITAMLSLMHFRLPYVEVTDSEDIIVHPFHSKIPVDLHMHHIPICITFAFFDTEDAWCVDPQLEEDLVSTSSLTVAMNRKKEVCLLHKPGGLLTNYSIIVECAKIALAKAKWVTEEMLKNVKRDYAEREEALVPVYYPKVYKLGLTDVKMEPTSEPEKDCLRGGEVKNKMEKNDEDEYIRIVGDVESDPQNTYVFDLSRIEENERDEVDEDAMQLDVEIMPRVNVKEKRERKTWNRGDRIEVREMDDLTKAINPVKK